MKSQQSRYTKEFKAEAVQLAEQSTKSVRAIASDLGIGDKTLYAWIKQAKIDSGKGPTGALTTEEKEELRTLRKENRELKMERELLKKATAFFARESK